LWNLYHDYKESYEESWNKGDLGDLDPDTVETNHKNMSSLANKLTGRFDNMRLTKPSTVASTMSKNLMAFRTKLPIIRSLCNPGL
jgi:predicted aconitase with swiveling domain